MRGREKTEIPERTRRPTASSGTIPPLRKSRVARPGIEPGSPCDRGLNGIVSTLRGTAVVYWVTTRLPTRRTGCDSRRGRFRIFASGNRNIPYPCITQNEHRSCQPMRLRKVSMEQRRNAGAGETGDPRQNPPTSSIVRRDSQTRVVREDMRWQEFSDDWNSQEVMEYFAEKRSDVRHVQQESPHPNTEDPLSDVLSTTQTRERRLPKVQLKEFLRGRGGVVIRLLASHQSEAGSIPGGIAPGFSHVVGGFTRGSHVSSAFAFWSCFILISLHPHRLSRTLDKSRQNFFTHS
ncbi:hypothetical protein PR048_021986 [Dryococelus australis]|uniref:Uncharacterized protein n=1 Tax=Dryococelus australis TaxID=614101 RepID=A0ABQ9GZQ7_9NEOP|nr:hypothetical protein PR048_021986 [Dryococelus australis]